MMMRTMPLPLLLHHQHQSLHADASVQHRIRSQAATATVVAVDVAVAAVSGVLAEVVADVGAVLLLLPRRRSQLMQRPAEATMQKTLLRQHAQVRALAAVAAAAAVRIQTQIQIDMPGGIAEITFIARLRLTDKCACAQLLDLNRNRKKLAFARLFCPD